MSETYYIIRNIIKDEYKIRYSLSHDRKKLLRIFIPSTIFTFAGLLPTPLSTIIKNILLAMGIIGIIIFLILTVRKNKEELPKDPLPFISNIQKKLSKYVNSVAAINELSIEIDIELLKHEKNANFFSNVYQLFSSEFSGYLPVI